MTAWSARFGRCCDPSTASGRPAVFLDRDGTLIEDIGYLALRPRGGVLPVDGRCRSRAQSGRPSGRRHHESVRRGARHPHRGDDRRCASASLDRCSTRAAPVSTRITIVRTIPRAPWRLTGSAATAASPGGMIERAAATSVSTRRDRSSSATNGSTWAPRVPSARAAFWSARDTAQRRDRSRRRISPADAVVDNLVEAVSWILRSAITIQHQCDCPFRSSAAW